MTSVNIYNQLPLHRACVSNVRMNILKLLIDMSPSSVLESRTLTENSLFNYLRFIVLYPLILERSFVLAVTWHPASFPAIGACPALHSSKQTFGWAVTVTAHCEKLLRVSVQGFVKCVWLLQW